MIKINERYKQIYHDLCRIADKRFFSLGYLALTEIAQDLYYLGYASTIKELSPIYVLSEELKNEKENS